MSKLRESLERLRSLEQKIKVFENIKQSLLKGANELNTSDPEAEVLNEVISFIDKRISEIEEGNEKGWNGDVRPPFTPEQLKALHQMLQSTQQAPVVTRGAFINEEGAETPNPTPPKIKPTHPVDPLKFAMQYRHLDRKEVIVTTAQGEVKAVVQGVDPTKQGLIVKTVTGHTAVVSPDTVREV